MLCGGALVAPCAGGLKTGRKDLWCGAGLGGEDASSAQAALPPGSSQLETVKVHDLVPGCHKVVHKRCLSVLAGINLRDGAELGV